MENKHAFLIIYHNEFEVTKLLIEALDDLRNDIFIHVDRKVLEIPKWGTKYANLYILNNRIDVRWGDFSVVQAELNLFKESSSIRKYKYYHLLSGVDFCIKSQNFIHNFFKKHDGKEFIGFSTYDYNTELDAKVKRYHIFPKYFRSTNNILSLTIRLLRFVFMRIQKLLNISRNKNINFKKGTQWVSVTNNFVEYILSQENNLYKIYKNTFCPDEIYKQTLCWNSPFRHNAYSMENENVGCMRMIVWEKRQIVEWSDSQFEELLNSEMIFARKFSIKNLKLITKIKNSFDYDA